MARKNPVIHLEGMEELNKALRAVGLRAGGFTLRRAAEAGAEVIREEAERLAPRGDEPSNASAKYGRLSDNIRKEIHREQGGRIQINVGWGTDQFWGLFLEKGTDHQPATPFLRPAFDGKADEAARMVREILEDALRDVLE
jgi:HK97 gp10 family phage protein